MAGISIHRIAVEAWGRHVWLFTQESLTHVDTLCRLEKGAPSSTPCYMSNCLSVHDRAWTRVWCWSGRCGHGGNQHPPHRSRGLRAPRMRLHPGRIVDPSGYTLPGEPCEHGLPATPLGTSSHPYPPCSFAFAKPSPYPWFQFPRTGRPGPVGAPLPAGRQARLCTSRRQPSALACPIYSAFTSSREIVAFKYS